MNNHPNEDELAEGVEDLSLNPPPTYDQLVAALAKEKSAHKETRDKLERLEIDFGDLDNDKRSFEAEVKVLDENEELKKMLDKSEKKVDMYEECLDIVKTATAGEKTEVKEKEDVMMIDEVVEKEEEMVVCKFWAQRGRCRYGYERGSCEHGYHPPKEDSKLAKLAEMEEEKAFM